MAIYRGPKQHTYQIYESVVTKLPVIDSRGTASYHQVESFQVREQVKAANVDAALVIAKNRYGYCAAVSYPGEHRSLPLTNQSRG